MGLRRAFFPGKVTPTARAGSPRHLGDLKSASPYWGQASDTIRTTDWMRPVKNLIRWLKWPIIFLAIIPVALSFIDPELPEQYLLTIGHAAYAVAEALLTALGWIEAQFN
jgi:hypothetical protein